MADSSYVSSFSRLASSFTPSSVFVVLVLGTGNKTHLYKGDDGCYWITLEKFSSCGGLVCVVYLSLFRYLFSVARLSLPVDTGPFQKVWHEKLSTYKQMK